MARVPLSLQSSQAHPRGAPTLLGLRGNGLQDLGARGEEPHLAAEPPRGSCCITILPLPPEKGRSVAPLPYPKIMILYSIQD